MNQPFSITCGEVDVEMGGNTVLLDKNNKPIDQPGEVFEFWKCELQVSHHENYVVLTGSPRTDVTVSVTEHLFRDGKMGSVDPFSEKNGIRKYSSRNDLYVVFQRTDGERRVYVICHRQYPTGRVIWDTGSRKRLPTELTDRTTASGNAAPKPEFPNAISHRPRSPSRRRGLSFCSDLCYDFKI